MYFTRYEKRAGLTAIIKSRVRKTWGQTESGLDEMLTERMAYLDEVGGATIAFQASGIEGLKVRITVKAGSEQEAEKALSDEEKAVREIIGEFVFEQMKKQWSQLSWICSDKEI